VVRGLFVISAKGDRPASEHWSWWYGPDRWANGWGGLDYSVHVFPTKRAAEESVRERGINSRPYTILPVQDAIAMEIDSLKTKRESAVASKRADIAMACTKAIKSLRKLQR
jgi:hypothetical protein